MSELEFAEGIVTSASATPAIENIAERKIIVYETLVDPAVARIAAEKSKSKLFNRFVFKLSRPEEIEFVSIEKYYEPYIVVSGKYSIDYFRKCTYSVMVDKAVREVILLGKTFTPEQFSGSSSSAKNIRLQGEERLFVENRCFLILNKSAQDSKLNELPSAPSERNPQELIETYKMQKIDPNVDVAVMRRRIEDRPGDVNRIVNEVFEIDQRSVIYTPRFKLTYKCPKIGKEACLEFDGVTSKLISQNQHIMLLLMGKFTSRLKMVFGTVRNWASRLLDFGNKQVFSKILPRR